MSADDSPSNPAMSPTDLHCFIYTGGTTGLSKGCVINHNYCVTLAKQIAVMWERGPDDVVWTPLPLFHYNAVTVVLVGTLLTGGRAAIYRKFSVSNFWPEINRTGATHATTLGTMVTLLANDPIGPRRRIPECPKPTRPCGSCRACRCRRPSRRSASSGSASSLRRGVRHDRGSLWSLAAARHGEQAERGGDRQRRVLGRPHLRRRRQRGAGRDAGGDRRPAEEGRT